MKRAYCKETVIENFSNDLANVYSKNFEKEILIKLEYKRKKMVNIKF